MCWRAWAALMFGGGGYGSSWLMVATVTLQPLLWTTVLKTRVLTPSAAYVWRLSLHYSKRSSLREGHFEYVPRVCPEWLYYLLLFWCLNLRLIPVSVLCHAVSAFMIHSDSEPQYRVRAKVRGCQVLIQYWLTMMCISMTLGDEFNLTTPVFVCFDGC